MSSLAFSASLSLKENSSRIKALPVAIQPAVGSAESRRLVFLDCTDNECMNNSIDLLEANGYQVNHIFAPNSLIIRTKPLAVNQERPLLSSIEGISSVHSSKVSNKIVSSMSESQRFASLGFNKMLEPIKPLPANVDLSNHLIVREEPEISSSTERPLLGLGESWLPYGAGLNDTSEFMLGRIGVFTILPECTGVHEDCTQGGWAQDEIDTVHAAVISAKDWWITVKNNIPLSGVLQFTYYFEDRIPTGYEPIEHDPFAWSDPNPCLTNQYLWMDEVLRELDATGQCEQKAINYINMWRGATGNLDWGFIVYAVDSAPAQHFPGCNYRGYAYEGGPFAVVADPHTGFTEVLTHEIGHIFYALDQYDPDFCSCTEESEGYIHYENQNCKDQVPECESNVESIMRDIVTAYPLHALDDYAAGMIGWADPEEDGIPEVLDTFPKGEFLFDTPSTQNDNWLVRASVQPLQRSDPAKNNITLNEIYGLEAYIDGAWPDGCLAEGFVVDGSIDEPVEDFILTKSPTSPTCGLLSEGWHEMDLEVGNKEKYSPSLKNTAHFFKDFFVLSPECLKDSDCGILGYCRADYLGARHCVYDATSCTLGGVTTASQGFFYSNTVFRGLMNPPWCGFGHWAWDPFLSSNLGSGTTHFDLSLSAGDANTETKIRLPRRASVQTAKFNLSGKELQSGGGLMDSFEGDETIYGYFGDKCIPPDYYCSYTNYVGQKFTPTEDYELTQAKLKVISGDGQEFDQFYVIDLEDNNAVMAYADFIPIVAPDEGAWVGGDLNATVPLTAGHNYGLLAGFDFEFSPTARAWCKGEKGLTEPESLHSFEIAGPYLASNSGNSRCSYELYSETITYSNPSNIEIDLGANGSVDGTVSGELTEEIGPKSWMMTQPIGQATELTNLIRACNCPGCTEYWNYCTVPISIKSDTNGKVELDSLAIEYSYPPKRIDVVPFQAFEQFP